MTYTFQHLNHNEGSIRRRLIVQALISNLEEVYRSSESNLIECSNYGRQSGKSRRKKRARDHNRPVVQMQKFERIYLTVNTLTVIWHFSLLLKYSLQVFLRYELISGYNYIGCGLIGRLQFYGVDQDFIALAIVVYSIMRLYWLLSAFDHQDYYFDWLEFLFREEDRRRKLGITAKSEAFSDCQSRKFDGKSTDENETRTERRDSISTSGIDPIRVAPNRDTDAFEDFRSWAIFVATSVVSICVFCPLFSIIFQLPLVLTRQGLAKGYNQCISYLTSNETDVDQLLLGPIYRGLYLDELPTSKAKDGSEDAFELVQFNWYQIARITFELYEGVFLLHDLIGCSISSVFFQLMSTHDVLYYSDKLLVRMDVICSEIANQRDSYTPPKSIQQSDGQ